MKKVINLNKIIIALSFLCLFSNNVMADCNPTCDSTPVASLPTGCDSTAGMHFPGVTPPNYLGNASSDSFDCTMNGSKQLSLEQINERAALLPPSVNNRFYIMLGGNAASQGLENAQNASLYNIGSTMAIGTLSDNKVKVASNNFEIGFGYTWSDFAMDIEWLALNSINYTASINNVAPSAGFTFNSTVTGQTLLGNIYWYFNDMYNIKLYAVFSVGVVYNESTTYIIGGPITTMGRYMPDGGIGIGGRFNLVSSLYVDVAGRFLILGKAKMSANSGDESVYVKAWRTWLGASVRLLWLL